MEAVFLLQSLEDAHDADSVEKLLRGLPEKALVDRCISEQICTVLCSVLTRHSELGLNAKLRRKVKRLRESYSGTSKGDNINNDGTVRNASSDLKSAVINSTEESALVRETQLPALDVEVLVKEARAVTSAAELEHILLPVGPGIVKGCHARRALKRAVEGSLQREDVQLSMNAKTRRRVQRVLQMLSPGTDAEKQSSTSETSCVRQQGKKRGSGGEDERGDLKKRREESASPPCVFFVGQLPYDATKEDLRTFLSEHLEEQGYKNDTGGLRVRMLTERATGQGRGMAFVSLPSPNFLPSCLALHHTLFKGRKINVERSCGGKEKKRRKERLGRQRGDQRGELEGKMRKLLSMHGFDRGEIGWQKLSPEFKEKLFSFPAGKVEEALRAAAGGEGKGQRRRSWGELDKALSNIPQ